MAALAAVFFASLAQASEYHGQVTFNGLPLPGATVTATHETKSLATVTDQKGSYSFADLPDGSWTVTVAMTCFTPVTQTVVIAPNAPPASWELKLLPLDRIMAGLKLAPSQGALALRADAAPRNSAAQNAAVTDATRPTDDATQRPSDGFLVNGSQNNAATSPFTMSQAFGNSRTGQRGLYTGGLSISAGNSALDARPYSLSGLSTPKPSYNQFTAVLTLGGPLNIPHLMPRGPDFFIAYAWTRDRDATTLSGLVPDAAERSGDLSALLDATGKPLVIVNPATGQPFTGSIPVSPQAAALLRLYPLPNVPGNPRYNYQVPVTTATHADALESRLDRSIGSKDQLYGGLSFLNSRTSGANLFGFIDHTATLGISANANWGRRVREGVYTTTGYKFSRLRTAVNPYFKGRENVSGEAGISGNDQSPSEWGPPALEFSSGIAPLFDAQSAFNRNRTDGISSSTTWNHGHHYSTFGGDFRRQQFNYLSQQDPRGTFAFTGAATSASAASPSAAAGTGSDLADFLLGIPDTSSIAFGNADKYLRQSVYDAYFTDDWRLRPDLTVNAGLRWEYGAPITELHGRLVNLDVASGFAAVAPVLGSRPQGPLTGEHYPSSLIRPDKRGFEPRIGVSWRPLPGKSVVVRGGYGIYDDTSVYQSTALELSQQAPLSKSLRVQNSAACPLTLADAFNACSSTTADNYAVDPDFRVGYAQNWQLAIQTDLPAALQMTATYLGIKGTHGVQEYLPNTYPDGAQNPCPACPLGFVYRSSGGNSAREAGQIQLRRRLRSGFAASLRYTYSKSIDDDSVLGGAGQVASAGPEGIVIPQPAASPMIAQDWRNLRAERGPSTFDQRHLLNLQMQYTTGMGLHGGTLMTGWHGRLLKDWTVVSSLVAGSGLPETPIYFATVAGTGVTGNIRPDSTGAPLYSAPAGLHLNPAAFTAPPPGHWGAAGRDSIRGPGQFSLDASIARTFRWSSRLNLDMRVDSVNLLNHAVFTSWISVVNSSQFGLPAAANPMRSLEISTRLRF
ncbi:MAG TPA: TonB-dependent receptor [Acidisarcina sp.]